MKGLSVSLSAGAVLLATMVAFAAEGAASKEELGKLYQSYFRDRNEEKVETLVYWFGVTERDRESFYRSLRNDLNYRVKSVQVMDLAPNSKFEYTRDGVTYVPGLPPVARLVVNYQGRRSVTQFSTSYLVGAKAGRYFIVLATPKAR